LLAEGVSEGIAIATGLKQARKAFTPTKKKKEEASQSDEKTFQKQKVKNGATKNSTSKSKP
jgi:hypothetical protein